MTKKSYQNLQKILLRSFLKLFLIAFSICIPVQALWFNGDWSSREKITIKASRVNGDLTDFPVYLNLNDLPDSFFAGVNGQGADIRITQNDGFTETAFELVDIDTINGSGELWFKAPALSSSLNTDFFVYYGNQGAVAYADTNTYGAHQVWSNGFVAVYHLHQSPTGGAGSILDSTSFNNHANPIGSFLSSDLQKSQLGKGIYFEGNGNYILIPNSASLENVQEDNYNVSAWFRAARKPFGAGSSDKGLYGIIIKNGYHTGLSYNQSNTFSMDHWLAGNVGKGTGSDPNYPIKRFHKAASSVDYDLGQITFQTNDASKVNTALGLGAVAREYNTESWRIGLARPTSSYRWYAHGIVDEVTISNKIRSIDWMSTEYQNQKAAADFYLINNGQDAGFDQSLWSHYQKITIPASEINSDLMDFPVYLNLADLADDFFTIVQSDGRDIRVTKADKDSQQAFELVDLDVANAGGELWFKAEDLSSTQDNVFYIWYGNALARAYSRSDYFGSENVWSNEYVGVWHMNQDPSQGQVLDSTVNRIHLNGNGSLNDQSGFVGQSINFNGVDDILFSDPSVNPIMLNFTLSLWFNTSDNLSEQRHLCTYKDSTPSNFYCTYVTSSSEFQVGIRDASSPFTSISNGTVENDTWYFYTSTRENGASLKLFADAILINTTTALNGNLAHDSGISIGDDLARANPFNGSIDEVRISSSARSQDWISVEFQNQNSPGNFYLIQNGHVAGFDSSLWAHKHKITIPAAVIASDLEDFPVYVDLADLPLTFFSRVQASGADIRVTKADQHTQLAFELVDLDINNASGELWFKADLLSSTNDNDFYIWYNNPQAQAYDRSNEFGSENVWTKGYVGVWHLAENGNVYIDGFKDSTSNRFHGTGYNLKSSSNIIGNLGKGILFNGYSDYIALPDLTGNFDSDATITAWVKNELATPISFYRTGFWRFGAGSFRPHHPWLDSNLYVDAFRNDRINLGNNSSFDKSQWYKLTISNMPGANGYKLYQDDLLQFETLGEPTVTMASSPFIGRSDNQFWYDGAFDEIQLSNVTRSPAWLHAEYQNQKNIGTFYIVDNGILNTSAWSHLFKITILASQVNGDLTDFPVYVDLADMPAEFFNIVDINGADLRITLNDQRTQTAFELVSIDTANGQGELWFKAPFLSSTIDTDFYLLAGNTNVQAYPRDHIFGSENVWTNGFVAVYHMHQDPSQGQILDSSSFENHGVANATMLSNDLINTKLNKGLDLDGIDDNISIPYSGYSISEFTASLWLNFKGLSSGYLFDLQNPRTVPHLVATNEMRWFTNGSFIDTVNLDLLTANWYYMNFTCSSSQDIAEFFVNGDFITSRNGDGCVARSPSGDFKIASRFNDTVFVNGIFDEVRFSVKARSSQWIKTEFNNQNSPFTFYTIERINRGNAIMHGRMF